MDKYFAMEMRLLQDALQQFAANYPQQACVLSDPMAARLCEGFAFLTSQLKQQLDDDWPEIAEQLIMQFWPYLLRPIPALSIAQFTPHLNQLQQGMTLPRGTVCHSKPLGESQIACPFKTTTSVTLYPLHISHIQSMSSETSTAMQITLQTEAKLSLNQLNLPHLKFYLSTDLAFDLYYMLTSQVIDVHIRFPDLPEQRPQYMGGQSIVKPCHFSMEDALLPLSTQSYLGFHVLLDYFALPEKFCFVELSNLQKIIWPEHNCQQFAITIRFKTPFPENKTLDSSALRLYSSPIVNLYHATTEPINAKPTENSYPLIIQHGQDLSYKLYNIEKLTGVDIYNHEQFEYLPFFKINPMQPNQRNYQLSHYHYKNSPYHLTLNGHSHEYLSCDVTLCNGDYLQQETHLDLMLPNNLNGIKGRTLLPVTPILSPPKRNQLTWQLLAHLSFNYRVFDDINYLKQLLACYNWSQQLTIKQRILALQTIATSSHDQIQQGMLVRILKIQLSIQENFFFNHAEIYLFGSILQHFFSLYCQLNHTVQLYLLCLPSQKVYTWQPQPGQNPPL